MYGYRHSIIDAQNREIAARNRAVSYSALLDDNWDVDTTRGFGLVENEDVDWPDFTAPDELFTDLVDDTLPF